MLGLGVKDKEAGRDALIVTARRCPDLTVVIQLKAVKVDGDIDLLLLGEGL